MYLAAQHSLVTIMCPKASLCTQYPLIFPLEPSPTLHYPAGLALGMVSQLPDEDVTTLSRRQMMARLDVAMGGRCVGRVVGRPGAESWEGK